MSEEKSKISLIPAKTDSRWKEIVLGEDIPHFSALPTKMLMMRIRLLARDKTPEKVQEAIDIAYDFFTKNSDVLKYDINLLFGTKDDKL